MENDTSGWKPADYQRPVAPIALSGQPETLQPEPMARFEADPPDPAHDLVSRDLVTRPTSPPSRVDAVVLHSRHLDPDPDPEGDTRLVIRCTGPAKRWAIGLGEHNAMTVSAVVWQGLLRIAEQTGYACGSYAPRRWPGRGRRDQVI